MELKSMDKVKTKIFADGADRGHILELYKDPRIKGFTTNPTLMKKAGITEYKSFALDILSEINDRPISFEVFSDDFDDMYRQGLEIASWGENVNVKVPICNTKGEFSYPVIERLAEKGVKQNITAIMTVAQVEGALKHLKDDSMAYISVFAGRIADTGVDPIPMLQECLELMKPYKNVEMIWASPRELLNIFQADAIGCHIITVTGDVLKKLPTVGKDLDTFSLETVQMFHRDAMSSGFSI